MPLALIQLANKNYAIVSPVKAIHHNLLYNLLQELLQIKAVTGNYELSICQAILNLLPRHDAPHPVLVGEIEQGELDKVFGEEGIILKLHQPEPDPVIPYPKQEQVTNVPLPTGGNETGKLLAQITIQLQGYDQAELLLRTLTMNELRSFLIVHGELSRPYEDRASEYRLDQYNKQIRDNPDLNRKVWGF